MVTRKTCGTPRLLARTSPPSQARTYADCVKVYDWTPLEKNSREFKYHCPQFGALALTEDLETGSRSELVNVVQP